MTTTIGGYKESDASKASALTQVTTSPISDINKNLLDVGTPSHIDSGNSTSTPLDADITFTGTAHETNGYGILYVNVFSNVASATDGLSIEQSSDGTNWDHTDTFTIPAGVGKNFSINPFAKWARVKYTNGGTNQTTFRLQTVFKQVGKASSHRVSDAISGEDDAELVKSVITGIDSTGVYQGVKTTPDGNLTISDNSSGLSIAQGNVTGVTFIHKFGLAPDFDQADGEVTIWDGAEDGVAWENMVYDYSSSADIQYISSTDNGDTQNIEIVGLDTNYNQVTQTIALDGQDSATLTTALIRVFRMKNVSATTLAGHVFCSTSIATEAGGGIPTAGNIRAIIHPGYNQTEMAIYTVPNGKTAYLRSWYTSTSGANKTSNYVVKLRAKPFGQVFQVKHTSAISDVGTSHIQHTYVEPEVFTQKTDIELTVEATASGITAAAVSGGFDIVLVNN